MDMIGIDLHKRESQLGMLTSDGELIERWILTSREGSVPSSGTAHGRGCGSVPFGRNIRTAGPAVRGWNVTVPGSDTIRPRRTQHVNVVAIWQ